MTCISQALAWQTQTTGKLADRQQCQTGPRRAQLLGAHASSSDMHARLPMQISRVWGQRLLHKWAASPHGHPIFAPSEPGCQGLPSCAWSCLTWWAGFNTELMVGRAEGRDHLPDEEQRERKLLHWGSRSGSGGPRCVKSPSFLPSAQLPAPIHTSGTEGL